MFPERTPATVEAAYALARDQYAKLGVNTEEALECLAKVQIALHCWQGDDVRGLETTEGPVTGGGILATGAHPGAARTGDELRRDAAKAMALIPGKLRFNLHAIYAETGTAKVGRDELKPEHFATWIDWAKRQGCALDFNPSYFAHPLASSGFTLSSADDQVRQFWIRHGIACRRIAEAMGRAQGSPCVLNHWIPDGAKDSPIDRWAPRRRLAAAYDAILAEPISPAHCLDCVEGKLFGIGSEDFVVGSHEFYLAYLGSRPGKARLCLDMGHYHPTETIHDKISALLTFQEELLLHVSRGVRWDSDHVVLLSDDLLALAREVVRGDALGRIHLALDFFDASINRIGAWVIGARATQKALLAALLEPSAHLRTLELQGQGAAKLAVLEELKTLPLGAVWDSHCQRADVPVGPAWINAMQDYEAAVLLPRAAGCPGGCGGACG
ncbi:MAG: L-rhamnose isomerase [Lentisphaeria bacterium]|jgi:L-rhamnose isomerase